MGIYEAWIEPFLIQHEDAIDENLDKIKEGAKHGVDSIVSKVSDKVGEMVRNSIITAQKQENQPNSNSKKANKKD